MSDSTNDQARVRTLAEVQVASEGGAFSRFNPRQDPDGAAKFALSAVGRGRGLQLASLATLMTEKSYLGELAGEPGWSLERRDDGNDMPGYAAWPPGAKYRAAVDPDSYRLPWPEIYYDRAAFHALVEAMVAEFEQTHPGQPDATRAVRAQL